MKRFKNWTVEDESDFFGEPVIQALLLLFQVVVGLQVEPELRRHAKVTPKPQGGTRGDGSLALDNFINAARGHADVFSQSVLGDAHRFEEFLNQDFAMATKLGWKWLH